jgi:predicted RNase H-like HicB family nuclease
MEFVVELHRDDEGYSICCPQLPGCWSQGDSLSEAIENIEDAIREYLAAKYHYLH